MKINKYILINGMCEPIYSTFDLLDLAKKNNNTQWAENSNKQYRKKRLL